MKRRAGERLHLAQHTKCIEPLSASAVEAENSRDGHKPIHARSARAAQGS
jgi:hypothetical protein